MPSTIPTPTPTPTSQLNLDPGPQPRRRAKLGCRCVLWLLAALVFLTGSYFGVFILPKVSRAITTPHYHLFQDLSLPYKPSDVVRPLVDSNQTFDIVATVWLRKNALEADTVEGLADGAEAWGAPRLVEQPIFSDAVFHGLQLKDKNVRTAVNLSIPTEIFKTAELWNYDLRASFVLVPTPPSPLTFAVNYSTWVPPRAHMPPMRPSYADDGRPLTDKIIDSYGILVPMLEFHPVLSKCEDERTSILGTDNGNDDSDDNWDVSGSSQPEQSKPPPLHPYRSTKGKSVLEAHPYVVTRTHIRAVDMVAVLNRKAYDREHQRLSSKSCRPGKTDKLPSWVECNANRMYGVNGIMETRIKLRKADENTGTSVTEWAYAPYLDYSYTANGPLDLLPVQISREQCLDSDKTKSSPIDSQEVMNITWNIAFSGKTPGKLVTQSTFQVSLLPPHEGRNMSATEYDMLVNQNHHAYINGLFGHAFDDDSHPRLHFALSFIVVLTFLIQRVLEFIYWFTRSSTVGISITGTALYVLGIFTQYTCEVVRDGYGSQLGLLGWIVAPFLRLDFLLVLSAPMMLKTITRPELRWKSSVSWVPVLHLANATHSERASLRVDQRTSRRHILMAYATLAAVFLTFHHFDLDVISFPGLSPPPDSKAVTAVLNVLSALFSEPAFVLGRVLQIIINFRTQRFSGAYKLQAILSCFSAGCAVIVYTPGIFGTSKIREDLALWTVVDFLLAAGLAWQAVIYPPVFQEEEVEEKSV